MTQWYSVDEPPESATREILVLDEAGDWNLGQFTKKAGFAMWDDQFHEYCVWAPITHWLPVPDLERRDS